MNVVTAWLMDKAGRRLLLMVGEEAYHDIIPHNITEYYHKLSEFS